MPVWKYNEKCHLKINDKIIIDYRVDVSNETPEGKIELFSVTKYMPYIMELTFYRYEFEQRNKEHIKGYTISKIQKIY